MLDIHKNITSCNNCTLCNNQSPLIHNNSSAEIFWVGLSAVKTENKFDMPLAASTNSGKLLYNIETPFHSDLFYRTNLVKCLPLDDKNKIRYPITSEMKNCISNLLLEIQYFKPKLIFLLGKPVASFVLHHFGIKDFVLDNEFNYSTFIIKNTVFVPIHHPSYILVYKRKKVDIYIKGIQSMINSLCVYNKVRAIGLYPEKVFTFDQTSRNNLDKVVSYLLTTNNLTVNL
jgi:uracil-DNA glycosylase